MKISGRREDKKTTAIIGRIRKDVGAYWGFAVVFVLYDIAAHAMFHAFCPSVFLFGLPCPGCGMTRAVFFFITGQFQRGMQMNPLGLLWILWAAYLVVMRYGFGKKAKGLMTAAGVIVVLMVAVYLYRMYCFFPGEPPISYTSGSLAERLIPGYRSGFWDWFECCRGERRCVTHDNRMLAERAFYCLLQRPDAPQGSTSPLSVTGSPISDASVCPPNFGVMAVCII